MSPYVTVDTDSHGLVWPAAKEASHSKTKNREGHMSYRLDIGTGTVSTKIYPFDLSAFLENRAAFNFGTATAHFGTTEVFRVLILVLLEKSSSFKGLVTGTASGARLVSFLGKLSDVRRSNIGEWHGIRPGKPSGPVAPHENLPSDRKSEFAAASRDVGRSPDDPD